ncbi:MAG: excinuclease ABC subunit UvrC [Bacteroidota bacterium]|nr:excinuclease ABC subunit UvrC [Bacteroidota bacterium]
MIPEKINIYLKTLPESPGVYQYFDENGLLLYVGKAKNLKKRVSSYFTKEHDNNRLRILVKKIAEIKTIKVNSELDALLLENNLIKNLKPRYNINLRDDKTYPWIILKNERFPRLFATRQHIKDGSEYFGPYANPKTMYLLLDLIRQMYPLRTCSLVLSQENIEKEKFRACLEFHIGRCKAPCVNKQGVEEYNKNINEIRQIIKGDLGLALRDLKNSMTEAAERYDYEKAEEIKNKIETLSSYQSKSTIVHPSITNTDVINLITDEKTGYAHYFKIINGAIIHAQTIELKKKIDESDEDLLLFAIIEFRNRFTSSSKEILVPFIPEIILSDCEYVVPKIGDKKQLLDLCYKNALAYKHEREKQIALTDPEKHVDRIMNQMMKDLRMTEQPRRIEGFDNSNIQGSYAVSAMPVFIDGKPAKKEYRHFNVKTVDGPNDFATMEEVITRRYSRVLEEKLPLPQLIVIDGGKGQLGAAVESLKKLNLMGKIAIIGIAKRLEEIYFPNDSLPLYLDKRSETLKIIQQIRDEAHRFGITHHRNKRSRETFKTELNQINGISDKTAEKLLIELKSVANIKVASFEELAKHIGSAKAKLVFDYFNKTETKDNL